MTLAVVIATEPTGGSIDSGPLLSAHLDLSTGTVLDRLIGQLSSLKVRKVRVVCRPEDASTLSGHDVVTSTDLAGDLRAIAQLTREERRAHGPEPVLLLHGDVISHQEVLHRLMVDTKAEALAVIARDRLDTDTPTRGIVRVQGGRVTSAGSPYHTVTDPNAVFRGVLQVSAQRAGTLAETAEQLADFVAGDPPQMFPIRWLRHASAELDADLGAAEDAESSAVPSPRPRPAATSASAHDTGGDGVQWAHEYPALLGSTPVSGADAPGLLLVGLVRAGVRVSGRGVRVLVCERVLTPPQARAAQVAVDAVNEDDQRLAAAVKNNDGLFTTYAVSTYSRYLARWAARLGLTPNMVTVISMAIAVLAAVWFAEGSRLGLVLGAVLLYFSFVFDCVDGQLARYTRQFSTLGAWLDATFDRAKEYVAFAGLAVGATASGVGDVWGLAIAVMGAQTIRHLIDFSYGTARRRISPQPAPVVKLSAPDDRQLDPPEQPSRPRGASHLVVRLSRRAERTTILRWAKRVIVLPIGERFALISVTAALFDARVTFLALLAWGVVAASYTVTGRVMRSLTP